ncbi:MAG: hypothetical protein GEU96_22895 [Propionibacteriales bacterium]|nr:hypothetical protein [Propionibacteriales bacterium]
MSNARHRVRQRGRFGLPRGLHLAPVAAVAAGLLVVLVGTFLLGRTFADGNQVAKEFTGVVASMADEGRVLCVEPDDDQVPTPFCDQYYVTPGSDPIEVGDTVLVRTIASRSADGSMVAGILVTPVGDSR